MSDNERDELKMPGVSWEKETIASQPCLAIPKEEAGEIRMFGIHDKPKIPNASWKKETLVSRPRPVISTGEADGIVVVSGRKPIVVFGTKTIRDGFDQNCLEQAVVASRAPGVEEFILNPDAHLGHGVPVGSVMASRDKVYPSSVGPDIGCSMSLLQLDLDADELRDPEARRAVMREICDRIPTGPGRGARSVPKGRRVDDVGLMFRAFLFGADGSEVRKAYGVPESWLERCERGHRSIGLEKARAIYDEMGAAAFASKMSQLGSLGGGNHFGECCRVEVASPGEAGAFGLRDGKVGFLTHCGSRGMGFHLAKVQTDRLLAHFRSWGIPLPGEDKGLVYAPVDSDEGKDYLAYMTAGGNFAVLNHLVINSLVLEAFQAVFPSCSGELTYHISHNFITEEPVGDHLAYVHRKGATAAYPARHHRLRDTPFFETGHPILLPGNARDGSVVMVARPGASKSMCSVNHGAGRTMGRREAKSRLTQAEVRAAMEGRDVLSNCEEFPVDEAPQAYKDFAEVVRSVELAGLASTVARLKPLFVIKDGDPSFNGAV
jgi:tRNA-splicing ligase RtcB